MGTRSAISIIVALMAVAGIAIAALLMAMNSSDGGADPTVSEQPAIPQATPLASVATAQQIFANQLYWGVTDPNDSFPEPRGDEFGESDLFLNVATGDVFELVGGQWAFPSVGSLLARPVHGERVGIGVTELPGRGMWFPGAKGSKLATCTWMRRPGKFMDMQLTVGQRCRWDRCVRPPAHQETDGTGARAHRLNGPLRPGKAGSCRAIFTSTSAAAKYMSTRLTPGEHRPYSR